MCTYIMCPVQYLYIQYIKPCPHSDMRSCCLRSFHAFTSKDDSVLLGNPIRGGVQKHMHQQQGRVFHQ